MIWDVLSGSKIIDKNFERGGIIHVDSVLSGNSTETDGGNNSWMKNLEETNLLVAYEENEAQIINFKDFHAGALSSQAVSVPVAALEGPSRGARLLIGAAAAAASGQRVASSPCGKYIASASRGVVCLISAVDLRIIDAVKLKGVPKKIKSLAFDSSGRQFLISTTDRFVRIYNIITPSLDIVSDTDVQEKGKQGEELVPLRGRGVDLEYLVAMAGDQFFQEGSFIHQQNKNTTTPTSSDIKGVEQLKLTRLFDAQVEKVSWGACAFSSNGQHLVTAIDPSSNEHVIYTWNIPHGYAENTLQAGSDGIVELTWHPELTPMQLVAIGKTGKMYVWAKVMTQDWSAFAPDFETLIDNREHIEEETEFDVDVKIEEKVEDGGKKESKKKSGGKNQSSAIDSVLGSGDTFLEDDEEIDIESWEWLDAKNQKETNLGGGGELPSRDDVWKAGWSAACTSGPLLHLPVIWPTEPVEEDDAEEIKTEEEEDEEEAVPMVVDDDEGGGGQEKEKLGGFKENGEADRKDDIDVANKKARKG